MPGPHPHPDDERRTFTRRAVLTGASACAIAASFTALALDIGFGPGDPLTPIRRIGRAYLDQYPDVTSRTELASQLGLAGATSAAEGALAVLDDRDRIAADFAARHTVNVDGWLLSVTEARAAAILADAAPDIEVATLAAVAAVMLTLENKNFFGNQGQGYLLTAIASVLIGGTSIFGGRATIVGTAFGAIIILMIEPALVAAGLTGAWVRTVQGLVFLIAIIFYLTMDEPQRRTTFFRRMGLRRSFGGGSR